MLDFAVSIPGIRETDSSIFVRQFTSSRPWSLSRINCRELSGAVALRFSVSSLMREVAKPVFIGVFLVRRRFGRLSMIHCLIGEAVPLGVVVLSPPQAI